MYPSAGGTVAGGVVNESNLKAGIQEIRPIDSAKMRKVKQVKKEKDPQTGANIINLGLKETSSSNSVIRQMGLRRLMGAFMTSYATGTGLVQTAQFLTNSTDAQWDAYKDLLLHHGIQDQIYFQLKNGQMAKQLQ